MLAAISTAAAASESFTVTSSQGSQRVIKPFGRDHGIILSMYLHVGRVEDVVWPPGYSYRDDKPRAFDVCPYWSNFRVPLSGVAATRIFVPAGKVAKTTYNQACPRFQQLYDRRFGTGPKAFASLRNTGRADSSTTVPAASEPAQPAVSTAAVETSHASGQEAPPPQAAPRRYLPVTPAGIEHRTPAPTYIAILRRCHDNFLEYVVVRASEHEHMPVAVQARLHRGEVTFACPCPLQDCEHITAQLRERAIAVLQPSMGISAALDALPSPVDLHPEAALRLSQRDDLWSVLDDRMERCHGLVQHWRCLSCQSRNCGHVQVLSQFEAITPREEWDEVDPSAQLGVSDPWFTFGEDGNVEIVGNYSRFEPDPTILVHTLRNRLSETNRPSPDHSQLFFDAWRAENVSRSQRPLLKPMQPPAPSCDTAACASMESSPQSSSTLTTAVIIGLGLQLAIVNLERVVSVCSGNIVTGNQSARVDMFGLSLSA